MSLRHEHEKQQSLHINIVYVFIISHAYGTFRRSGRLALTHVADLAGMMVATPGARLASPGWLATGSCGVALAPSSE